MKLSNVKQILPTLENVEFQLENGTFVPEHFHVTEVGMITKNFIDCGGVIKKEKVLTLNSNIFFNLYCVQTQKRDTSTN